MCQKDLHCFGIAQPKSASYLDLYMSVNTQTSSSIPTHYLPFYKKLVPKPNRQSNSPICSGFGAPKKPGQLALQFILFLALKRNSDLGRGALYPMFTEVDNSYI